MVNPENSVSGGRHAPLAGHALTICFDILRIAERLAFRW